MEEKRSMEWNKEHGKNCKRIPLGNFDQHLTYVSAGSPCGQGLRGRPSKGQIWVLGLARHEGKGREGNTWRVLAAGEGSDEDLGNWRRAAAGSPVDAERASERGVRGSAHPHVGFLGRSFFSRFFCSFLLFLFPYFFLSFCFLFISYYAY
jgi:hypothetical protein